MAHTTGLAAAWSGAQAGLTRSQLLRIFPIQLAERNGLSLNPPRAPHSQGPSERRRTFRLTATAGLLILILASLPALAQNEPTGAHPGRPGEPFTFHDGMLFGALIFSPSVLLSTTYDDNIFNVGHGATEVSGPVGGTVGIARAKLAVKLPFSHSYASLSYAPEYREYGNTRAPLKFSQELAFDSRLSFVGGQTVQIKDYFVDGFSDIRRLATTGGGSSDIVFSSTPYRTNTPEIAIDWIFAYGWGFLAHVKQIDFSVGRTADVDVIQSNTGATSDQQSFFDLFDFVTNEVEFRGYRNFSRYQLFGAATVARTNQDRRKFNESHANPQCPNTPLDSDCDEDRSAPSRKRTSPLDRRVEDGPSSPGRRRMSATPKGWRPRRRDEANRRRSRPSAL